VVVMMDADTPLAPEVAEALAMMEHQFHAGGEAEFYAALALITRELERGARVEAAARRVLETDARRSGGLYLAMADLRDALAPQEEER
jgi:hypothetical protein